MHSTPCIRGCSVGVYWLTWQSGRPRRHSQSHRLTSSSRWPAARGPCASSQRVVGVWRQSLSIAGHRPRSEQHQIVAMDQLVAAAIAEQRRDLLGLLAADPARVGGVVGGQALGQIGRRRGRAPGPRRRARSRPRRRSRRPAAGCCRASARAPRRRRSGSRPSRRARRRSSPCARGAGWRGPGSGCRGRRPRAASSGCGALPGASTTAQPAPGRDLGRGELADHAAGADEAAGAAGHRLDLGRDRAHQLEPDRAPGSRAGSAV